MSTTFGINIRQRRREAGLSQWNLAARTGLSQTWISRLERGKENPTLETLGRLASALDVRLVELLQDQEQTQLA